MVSKPKNVTVVIPVYGDWPSLEKCLTSLKEHLPARHKVLLVNDCGPEIELMEKNIHQSISGQSNFEYHRNNQNLGFLKTCNRGVELDQTDNDILLLNSDTEVTPGFLDEMGKVLYGHPMHGCVTARSSNATIATIPLIPREPIEDRDHQYAYKVWSSIKNLLPEYSVAPVAMGYCLLIKRELIEEFGLFDEIYGLGYGEENDFCLRINAHGYSSLIANKAFVYHFESRSFTSQRRIELIAKNEKVLIARYPFYYQWVERYINRQIHSVDYFADLVGGPAKPRKALIWLTKSPESSASKTDFQKLLTLLNINNCQISLAGAGFADEWGVSLSKVHQVDPWGSGDLFHLAVLAGLPKSLDELALLNRKALSIAAYTDSANEFAVGSNIVSNEQTKQAAQDALELFDIVLADEVTESRLRSLFIGSGQSLPALGKKASELFMPDLKLLEKRWYQINARQNYAPSGKPQGFKQVLKKVVPSPVKKAIKKVSRR